MFKKIALSKKTIFIILLFLAAFVVYFNSLFNDFVFDDKALIVYNPAIKSAKFLPQIFQKDIYVNFLQNSPAQAASFVYRPLQLLSYYLDYKIWGLNPIGFHLTNLVLHLLNAVLLFYLLFALFSDFRISALASVLFLLHPLQTSVVSYIAGRADLLSFLFMLLAMFSFLKFVQAKNIKFYVLSLICALLALLSRENALILFVFILLIIFIQKVKFRQYFLVLPYLALNLAYFFWRMHIFGKIQFFVQPPQFNPALYLLNIFNLLFKYVLLLLIPFDLRLLRTTPFLNSFLQVEAIFAISFIVLLGVGLFFWRKNKVFVFGAWWFILGLLPVFMCFDKYVLLYGALMAESWVYVSSFGFFVVLVFMLIRSARIGVLILIILVSFYSVLTMANNFYWKKDLIIFKRILQFSDPRSPVRKSLINEYLVYGRYSEALDEIKKYEKYYSDDYNLEILYGNYYFYTQEISKAVARYQEAIRKKGNDFFVLYRLSVCYRILGQLERAVDFALEAYRINPYFIPNLIELGELYQQKNDLVLARKYFSLALALEPRNKVIRSLLEAQQ
jgi:tetratricopeptide (TPR) repeat protein